MIFHSIRWRLQAWHGLILVVVLAGFGFTAYHVARDNQLRRIDQDLDQRLMALFRPHPPDRPPDRPPDWQRGGPGQRGGFPPNEPRNDRPFGSPDFLRHIREAVHGSPTRGEGTAATHFVAWRSEFGGVQPCERCSGQAGWVGPSFRHYKPKLLCRHLNHYPAAGSRTSSGRR